MTEDSKPVALVTGATGFIGGRLAERLVADGWPVKLLVRNPDRLAPSLRHAKEIVVGDISDEDAVVRAVRDTDVIFHCAANVSTWGDWESYYSVNVLGVQNLLQSIARENPGLSRLVHISTVDVYGFPEFPCDELCKPNGGNFGYGETKLLGESLVRNFGDEAGISYTIIRPANVIGPGSQFISRIGHELKSGIMLTVDGGHTNAGMLYVDNLVDYLIWASGAAKAHRQCYNVRDAYDVTWADFIREFRHRIGGRGLIVNLPFSIADTIARGLEAFHKLLFPATEPLLHRLLVRFFGRPCGHSSEKIRCDSGFVGAIGFNEAMDRSCQWFLARGSK